MPNLCTLDQCCFIILYSLTRTMNNRIKFRGMWIDSYRNINVRICGEVERTNNT